MPSPKRNDLETGTHHVRLFSPLRQISSADRAKASSPIGPRVFSFLLRSCETRYSRTCGVEEGETGTKRTREKWCERKMIFDDMEAITVEWQTEPFTEKALRQLHEQPKVIIKRESVIRRTLTDHNVPDITDIASYVECTSASTQEFHANPSPPYYGDNIENELTRMFNNEFDKITYTQDTVKEKDNSHTSKKQKRKETLKELLVELFGSSLDDLSDPSPIKKIRTQRRHTLPISLHVDVGTLLPLRIKEKRRSEAGTTTNQKKELAVWTSVSREVEVNYTRVSGLVIPPVYTEVVRVSYSDYELETAYTMEKPVVGYSETVKASAPAAANKVTTIIDLTGEDTTMTDFEGIRVEVKGAFVKSESKACAPSMPLLSPVSPAEPTRAEKVLLTQRPPPSGKHPDLEIFPVGNATLGNQNTEVGARGNTQQNLALPMSAYTVLPQLNVLGNAQTNTYVQTQAQNLYGGNQQQTLPRRLFVGNPQRNVSGVMTENRQQNICGPSTFTQQNVCGPTTNHNGRTVAHVVPLKDKDKVQSQKRTNVENETSEDASRRRRSTDKPRTIAPAPAQEHSGVTLNGGGTVTVQSQQNPLQIQQPDGGRMNHSILEDLVQWEASRKRAMLQNQGNSVYGPNRLNFRVPEQWQWPAMKNQQMQRQNPEPNQLPPRLVRLLSAPSECTLISNAACAEKLYPHVNKFMQWRIDAHNFYEKTKSYLNHVDLKEHSNKFLNYSHEFRLVLSRCMIKELSGIDVRNFNMHEILTYLSVKVVVNSCTVPMYRIFSNIYTMLLPVEEDCNTPFLRKLFSNVKASATRLEEKSRRQVPLFTNAQLQILKKQIRQYTLIQNWLNANIGSVPLRVRIPQQKKPPPPYLKTRKRQRTVFDMPQQLQDTVARLQHENAPQSTNMSRETSTSERAVPVANLTPVLSASENVPTQTQETSANAQRNTVESGTSSTDSRNTFESVSLQALTTRESIDVQTPANVHVPENPQVVVEDIEEESQSCNKEQEVADSEVSGGVKNETEKEQDEVQEVIDLTWIEDGDQEEMLEEIIECKYFPFKVENYEESEEGATAREVISPTDSGLGSPVAQLQSDGDGFKCLCGNKAIYVCACNSSMYCSSDCQVRDWVYHQKLCHKMKS